MVRFADLIKNIPSPDEEPDPPDSSVEPLAPSATDPAQQKTLLDAEIQEMAADILSGGIKPSDSEADSNLSPLITDQEAEEALLFSIDEAGEESDRPEEIKSSPPSQISYDYSTELSKHPTLLSGLSGKPSGLEPQDGPVPDEDILKMNAFLSDPHSPVENDPFDVSQSPPSSSSTAASPTAAPDFDLEGGLQELLGDDFVPVQQDLNQTRGTSNPFTSAPISSGPADSSLYESVDTAPSSAGLNRPASSSHTDESAFDSEAVDTSDLLNDTDDSYTNDSYTDVSDTDSYTASDTDISDTDSDTDSETDISDTDDSYTDVPYTDVSYTAPSSASTLEESETHFDFSTSSKRLEIRVIYDDDPSPIDDPEQDLSTAIRLPRRNDLTESAQTSLEDEKKKLS